MTAQTLRAFCFGFVALLASSAVLAQQPDPNTQYLLDGKAVYPWEFSLQFGQEKIISGNGKTTKGALVASPAGKESDNDAVNLKWTPKDVRNEWGTQNENIYYVTLTNTMTAIDLSGIKDQAALVFDVKIIKPPKKHVNLWMEAGWDWKQRTSIPLKAPLKKLPKNKWISFPVPLQCFDDGEFDFSKVTSVFMLNTMGKMEIEIGDIYLSAYPADKVKCANR
ncbi:putative glycoside hydrolase [Agaribacterium haliotis]|uniref:putative glycoside hydrolase n=1 Tax=Agaribacterium haliotis TaxID=2013869 RepID=UPI000BB549DA|nr:putative glycoside hydrolase [Agaribacterium haliotis]